MDEVLKSSRRAAAGRVISIRGAREHNLKNVDLEIPRDKLVVFTGLSGSGKSSLAFDTIYAEGQRRYVESLSAYARQFLEMMQKPDVDQIDGLSPAISIEQKTTSKNPRSTVGTVTEIYDYMRLLWARAGVPYSPATGLPIESQTVSQMVDRVLALPQGARLYLLAPVARGRKGEYKKELAEYLKKGFQRVKIDGKFYELASVPALDKKLNHDIDVVVDRIVVRDDMKQRLAESFEAALKLAEGLAVIEFADTAAVEAAKNEAKGDAKGDKKTAKIHDKSGPERILFSEKFACPVSGFTIPEVEPRLFSFNNPYGACPACGGLGVEEHVDPELIIPDKDADAAQGRDRAMGEIVVALLHADAAGAGQALQVFARRALARPAQEGAGRDPRRLRRGRDQVLLRRRRALLRHQEAVRGRGHQHRAALERDRERVGARGSGEVFHQHPVRSLQRLPAEAGGAVRQGRHQAYRRDLRTLRARCRRLVRGGAEASQQAAERDCGAHPQGNPRAARLPARCRPRLSDAGARLRHAVGRREPAHSPRLADRLGADGRALCARRALHRTSPARQCATAGNAEAAARPRQHRDRGRARRRRDSAGGLRRRCRPRRRHPWRAASSRAARPPTS